METPNSEGAASHGGFRNSRKEYQRKMKRILRFQWANPQSPISRVPFTIVQFLFLSVAEALLPTKPLSGVRFLVFAGFVAALFSLTALLMAKRLADLGWSNRLAALTVGPAVGYLVLGGPRSDETIGFLVGILAVLSAISTIACGGAMILLMVRRGKS